MNGGKRFLPVFKRTLAFMPAKLNGVVNIEGCGQCQT